VTPADLDLFGHMNNSRYLMLMDFARIDYLARMGLLGAAFHYRWTVPVGTAQVAACQRHHRWVGTALLHSLGQISLRRAPEILAANQRHRRLVHHDGQPAASAAFADAFLLINDLYQRSELPASKNSPST
jgi:Thioesterase-like superfamily